MAKAQASGAAPGKAGLKGKKKGPEERAEGRLPHPGDVQQHDRHDRGPLRERRGVVERGFAWLQGLAQEHAVRGAARGGGRRPQGGGARRCAVAIFVKGPGAGRESALRALSDTRASASRSSVTSPRFRTTGAARPSVAASDFIGSRRRESRHGSLYRSGCKLCRREGMKLFSRVIAATPTSARSSAARTRRASTASAREVHRVRYPPSREAEGASHLRGARASVPQVLRTRPIA
jgi:hypothetical protein